MKTRWSLGFSPLWNSANKRTSSHPSSLSRRRSTFSTFTLWSLLLSLFCLVVPSLSHSLPFLYQRAYSRNIRPDPCVTKGGDRGVCMFAWDCMKANGTHLGTCIDRFYFGSCCKLDSNKRPITTTDTTELSNTIPDTSVVKPGPVKPSFINKPVINLPGTSTTDSGVTDITDTQPDEPSTVKPSPSNKPGIDLPGVSMTDITDTQPGEPNVIKPSPTNKPGIDLPGATTIGLVVSDIPDTQTDEPSTVKPGPNKNPGIDMPGSSTIGFGVTDISKTPPGEASTVKPRPTNMPGIDLLGASMIGSDVTDIPNTQPGEASTVKPSPVNMTGIDLPGASTIGSGVTHIATTPPGEASTVKPSSINMPENDLTGPSMNASGVTDMTDLGSDKPEYTGLTGSDDTNKPGMTDSNMTVVGVSEFEKPTPGTVNIGIEVTENDLPGVIGLGNENVTSSSTVITIDTAAGSTGTDIKPNEGEIEDSESDSDNNSGISNTTKSPGISGDGDNLNPIDPMGESQVNGDSGIIDDGDNSLESSDEATNKPPGEATNEHFDVATNIPLIFDEPQVSSTEPVGFTEIEPATSIWSPSTESPFNIIDEETMFPQEPVTTFSPEKQPSKTDEDKDDQDNATTVIPSEPVTSIAPTVIPSAIKPVKPSDNKTDIGEEVGYIELTTFFPPGTDKIEVDPNVTEETTDTIFTDNDYTPFEPSAITIKPKPAVTKPDNETVTEIPLMPEETTIIGGIIPLFPGVTGINVIPATTNVSDPGITGINVFPATTNVSDVIEPIGKPVIEQTTEITIPEPSTDKNIEDNYTDLIIISTTTESEKPLSPITNIPIVPISTTTESEKPVSHITNIPIVPIKPTTTGKPVTDDPTDWVPIAFPGQPTEKPITTSTEKITTQVKPQKPVDEIEEEEDEIEVAASTTIATGTGDILADRLNGSKYSEICGRPVYPTKRIVGGSDASFGEFPWQVSLRQWRSVTFLHKCGAALLNENWAVTAAHCVENVQPEQLLLRLGEFDLETAEEPYGFVERKVQIIATHPQFDARTFEYDLALLRFYEPIDFQPNVIPICIPDDDYNFIGDTGYVSGWGRLYEDGPLPSIMQKVPVPVITNPECEAMYKVAGYVEHIPQIFICAGYEAGLKDSCEGDSGGPMVIQRDGVWNLAGVISWGIGCALPNQPGVYTRISAFREWIEKIIVF